MDKQMIESLLQKTQKLSVLYVEDNDEARLATLDILNDFFHTVDSVHNGVEGLKYFKLNRYDIVITDINMPHMNGLEMIEKIKKIDPYLPVLIISAYNESNYFLETIKLGVEGYLLKPIDMQQYLMIMKKTVEKLALRYENQKYKEQLEQKVQQQVQELIQKDKIITQKSKLAVMGEMIDAIAHQFKQPLSVIQLQAQQLEYAYETDSIDEDVIKDATTGTIKQVEHLSETIAQFREFLRPDIYLEEISLQQLLQAVLVLMEDELKQYAIDISLKGDLDAKVKVIAGEFKHVLINLINNAKDAYLENDIKTDKKIELEVLQTSEKTIIDVKDNAGGIPVHLINDIFKPNVSSKKSSKNTGIGLYISKMIIKKVGATLEASNHKEGALFRIAFER